MVGELIGAINGDMIGQTVGGQISQECLGLGFRRLLPACHGIGCLIVRCRGLVGSDRDRRQFPSDTVK